MNRLRLGDFCFLFLRLNRNRFLNANFNSPSYEDRLRFLKRFLQYKTPNPILSAANNKFEKQLTSLVADLHLKVNHHQFKITYRSTKRLNVTLSVTY